MSKKSNCLALLNELLKAPVDIVYIVDSFGSLDMHEMSYLVEVFQKHLPHKTLGVHAHNNMQLAFANTLTAARKGVTFLDGSVYGMGRAAGNCNTELLLNLLSNPKYELRPVMKVIEQHMIPMRNKVEWGYTIPYMLTGALNEHPRTAMALRNSEDKDRYVDFYDKLTSAEMSLQESGV